VASVAEAGKVSIAVGNSPSRKQPADILADGPVLTEPTNLGTCREAIRNVCDTSDWHGSNWRDRICDQRAADYRGFARGNSFGTIPTPSFTAMI